MPLSWATCVIARGILGDQLNVGPKLTAWAQVEYANRVEPALRRRMLKALPPDDFWARIFDEIEEAPE